MLYQHTKNHERRNARESERPSYAQPKAEDCWRAVRMAQLTPGAGENDRCEGVKLDAGNSLRNAVSVENYQLSTENAWDS